MKSEQLHLAAFTVRIPWFRNVGRFFFHVLFMRKFMGIKFIPGKRIPAFFVVVYQYGFRKSEGTGTPVLCSAGEFLDGYPS